MSTQRDSAIDAGTSGQGDDTGNGMVELDSGDRVTDAASDPGVLDAWSVRWQRALRWR